ncbi:MAG TPA: class I SAM-dependent methyltransferase [Rhizomicrobium sp.]|jgi:SAM-dependent methyltransferase|nr:class I SAM-dependent methyltransferase [Rhizomicrobium sp.]
MSHAAAKNVLRNGVHHGPRIATREDHDIIECETCGFKHALPLPDATALEEVYREDYYAQEKPTFLAHAGEDQRWAELAQTDRLEILESLLPPDRRRLLDVGCGPGFFLQTALRRGWLAHGIEPSRQAAAHARALGATVTEGFFHSASAAALGRFDAVNLSNVLEHVPDPAHLVRLAHGLLEPGGVICATVPNEFSPTQIAGRAAVGANDWWVAPPHHLNYFNFDSLTALLTHAGFAAKARATSFPMEAFLMMGENYVNDPALGRACHNRRKKFDLAFEAAGLKETRRNFYRALAELGIGREAVVIAVKTP